MPKSAAETVKNYLEKYILINILKTKQCRYADPMLARKTLSVAFHIAEEMDELIKSNQENDITAINACLKQQIAIFRKDLKGDQKLLRRLFKTPPLPKDFGTCINQAWSQVEKQAA